MVIFQRYFIWSLRYIFWDIGRYLVSNFKLFVFKATWLLMIIWKLCKNFEIKQINISSYFCFGCVFHFSSSNMTISRNSLRGYRTKFWFCSKSIFWFIFKSNNELTSYKKTGLNAFLTQQSLKKNYLIFVVRICVGIKPL